MIKQEKVKLLLKYAEKYGFNVSKSHIFTKNGNVQRDATWREYLIGISEVKNAPGIYERGTNGVFDITVGPVVDLWAIGTDDARVDTRRSPNV